MATDYDVIVVGYGPVGQILALMLGRAGVRVAVVERHASLFTMPRAVHFDHEVGRIFQSAGIADQVRKVSHGIADGTIFAYLNAKREVLRRIRLGGESQSGWPFSNAFAQHQLETEIDAAVRQQSSVSIFMGWECTRLTQSVDAVTLEMRQREGSLPAKALTARYVIGSDGANSFVRTAMNGTQTDLNFCSDWLVVSIRYKSPDVPRVGMMQICDPARSITIAPGGIDRQRFEFMLTPGETAEQMADVAVTWKLLAEFGLNESNVDVERHSVYRFAARWADQWRAGRLLLAGDAAHVMPPFRAQGMCSGVRDAAALAWRLPMVLSGAAPDALLDSYGPERLPHVISLIHQTLEIGKFICISDPEAAAKRDAMMIAVAADPSREPKRQPLPKIGVGVTMDGDQQAGDLSYQGVIELDGKTGLFDDLVGAGFSLVGTAIDPDAHLSEANRTWFNRLGGVIAQVTPGGRVRDVEGGYARFFNERGVGAILSRPDFNIFGTARRGAEIDALVNALRAKLGMI